MLALQESAAVKVPKTPLQFPVKYGHFLHRPFKHLWNPAVVTAPGNLG